MKRMYGEFDMPDYDYHSDGQKRKRSTKSAAPDIHLNPNFDSFGDGGAKKRTTRQNFKNMSFNNNKNNESGR